MGARERWVLCHMQYKREQQKEQLVNQTPVTPADMNKSSQCDTEMKRVLKWLLEEVRESYSEAKPGLFWVL